MLQRYSILETDPEMIFSHVFLIPLVLVPVRPGEMRQIPFLPPFCIRRILLHGIGNAEIIDQQITALLHPGLQSLQEGIPVNPLHHSGGCCNIHLLRYPGDVFRLFHKKINRRIFSQHLLCHLDHFPGGIHAGHMAADLSQCLRGQPRAASDVDPAVKAVLPDPFCELFDHLTVQERALFISLRNSCGVKRDDVFHLFLLFTTSNTKLVNKRHDDQNSQSPMK